MQFINGGKGMWIGPVSKVIVNWDTNLMMWQILVSCQIWNNNKLEFGLGKNKPTRHWKAFNVNAEFTNSRKSAKSWMQWTTIPLHLKNSRETMEQKKYEIFPFFGDWAICNGMQERSAIHGMKMKQNYYDKFDLRFEVKHYFIPE